MGGLNEILAKLPALVSNAFNTLICIKVSENKVYKLEYNGDNIHVLKPIDLSELNTLVSDAIADEIINNSEYKNVIASSYIYITSIDDYKIVMISDFRENTQDKTELPVILIADDSPLITKFFVKTLKDEYEVLVAENGEEAINKIEENKNHLIGAFIDLNMPKKNGYEVLDYLTINHLFNNIPVSIISGEDSFDGISKATSVPGVVDMLQKPFTAEAARAIVAKTVSFSEKNK